MMLTLSLVLITVVSGVALPRLLRSARWGIQRPTTAMALWTVAIVTTPLALVGLGVSLLSASPAGHAIVDLVHACVMALHGESLTGVAPEPLSLMGLALLVVVARVPVEVAAEAVRGRRRGSHFRDDLRLLDPVSLGGLTVVVHSTPFAYSLPGRPPLIVVSSATLATLNTAELDAVVAHELGHLKGGHQHLLDYAYAAARALPFFPGLRRAQDELRRLLEMLADDHARRVESTSALQSALLRLSGADARSGGLGASARDVLLRVQRLESSPPNRATEWALATCALTFSALPLLVLGTNLLAAFSAAHCPID